MSGRAGKLSIRFESALYSEICQLHWVVGKYYSLAFIILLRCFLRRDQSTTAFETGSLACEKDVTKAK